MRNAKETFYIDQSDIQKAIARITKEFNNYCDENEISSQDIPKENMVNLILNNANSNADIDTFLLVKHTKIRIRLLFKSPKNQFIYYIKSTIEIASSASN